MRIAPVTANILHSKRIATYLLRGGGAIAESLTAPILSPSPSYQRGSPRLRIDQQFLGLTSWFRD